MIQFGRRWCAALLLALTAALTSPAALAGERLTVVELFTSQGCPSCPAADAYLAELAGRDDVLALGFHVDYWDYIGWRDPFADAAFTERQRDYASHLGLSYVYTPQMMVDGMWQEVGSDRDALEALIETAASVERERLDVELTPAGANRIRVRIAGDADAGAEVKLIRFDVSRTTVIAGGENRGRELVNVNIVRDMRTIATWDGRPLDLTVALAAAGDACAIIVQEPGPGSILGAAWIKTRRAD